MNETTENTATMASVGADGWLQRSRVHELAMQAALENIPGAALIVTATGTVERSNARARALMACDREGIVRSLLDSLRHPEPSSEFEVSPIFTYGNVAHYLAVQRAPRGPDCDRLAMAIHRWRFSPREARVLGHLVHGESNRQIASRLGCAERTVELHVTHILQRLDVENRTAAIAKFWTQP